MSQIYTVNLPDIGEGVVEGEVIEWLKNVNDPLAQDEPVVVVMTDKATVELPAPYPGRLVKQYFKKGEIAIKDKPLYDIERVQEAPASAEIKTYPKEKKATPKNVPTSGKGLAIPAVRHLAKEMGVDINTVAGTGKDGRVTLNDLPQSPTTPSKHSEILHFSDDEEVPLVGIRNLMAKKMAEANENIPHFSYFEQVDATRLVQLKHKYQEGAAKEGIHVTFMPFIIRALSKTLLKFPEANSSLDPVTNKLYIHKHHNIGIAISSQYGLIVPVLKNVQDLSLNDLIRAYEDIKVRAADNKLQANEMKESTITITNFGVLGGEGQWATPIINYPEVAILGLARIKKEPVVKNNQIVIRDMLHISWSFDHRVVDGDMGASISHELAVLLQNPAHLL